MSTPRLHIAVQKTGRLAEKSLELMSAAGYRVVRGANGLAMRIENAPIDLMFVRDDDIPMFVRDGVAQLGIVGRNVVEEHVAAGEDKAIEVMPLGFGRCSLKIAGPAGFCYDRASSLQGTRIATSYPHVLRRYLRQHAVEAQIVTMRGSVEAAPKLKLADLICDLVSTGATLESNGLVPFETVLRSEAVLIRTPRADEFPLDHVADTIIARFRGVVASQGAKYVMLNAPRTALAEISRILPGAGAPTVTPLAGYADAVAVHAVCQESVFWETLEALKAAGASAILVMAIEKMM